ncbi:hypothetical protein ACFWJL_06705, partial [Streptomyces sp. NPDC127105]
VRPGRRRTRRDPAAASPQPPNPPRHTRNATADTAEIPALTAARAVPTAQPTDARTPMRPTPTPSETGPSAHPA